MPGKGKKILQYFLASWWVWTWGFFLYLILFATEILPYNYYTSIPLSVFTVALPTLILCQLLARKWKAAIFSIFTIVICFPFSGFMIMMLDNIPDTFADNLVIPENIDLHIPINNFDSSTMPIYHCEKDHFAISKVAYGQGGLYNLILCQAPDMAGTVYLRAYEITGHTELSTHNLQDRTSLTTPVQQKALPVYKKFTIYEGDWGKYYAARFELWFDPESGNDSVLLDSKNYKIEGWMH